MRALAQIQDGWHAPTPAKGLVRLLSPGTGTNLRFVAGARICTVGAAPDQPRARRKRWNRVPPGPPAPRREVSAPGARLHARGQRPARRSREAPFRDRLRHGGSARNSDRMADAILAGARRAPTHEPSLPEQVLSPRPAESGSSEAPAATSVRKAHSHTRASTATGRRMMPSRTTRPASTGVAAPSHRNPDTDDAPRFAVGSAVTPPVRPRPRMLDVIEKAAGM
ncbi:hypothetical protein PLCT1_01605 [Planctomycetaceae bacterium]|nr:hypothetical protein PLCT1_01605 [Planctomycetaceae bacterium]